jgi:PiT family inorganic phosphate transporter
VLTVGILVALAFGVTNGFHDSATAVAGIVATRVARPQHALTLSAVFHFIGPLVVSTAVATTIATLVDVPDDELLAVAGAASTAAFAWNLFTWRRGLPSSSSHALVGGFTGAALAEGGIHAVHWGGFDGLRPTGVFGVLLSLAVAPLLGFGAAAVVSRVARRGLRRARRRVERPIRGGQWGACGALAFAQGAQDAPKTMAVVTMMLVGTGHLQSFAVPPWVRLGATVCLTAGTVFGGWRIARTVGRRIFRLRSLDALVTETTSATVVLVSAAAGVAVSPTHVTSSGVVGVGTARHRQHVHWRIVREILLGWCVTLPASAILGAAAWPIWRLLT